jgi:hypothetical protein
MSRLIFDFLIPGLKIAWSAMCAAVAVDVLFPLSGGSLAAAVLCVALAFAPWCDWES